MTDIVDPDQNRRVSARYHLAVSPDLIQKGMKVKSVSADTSQATPVRYGPTFSPGAPSHSSQRRSVASYELELSRHRNMEARLRESLAREELLLRQKDELIEQQKIMARESDHRLL